MLLVLLKHLVHEVTADDAYQGLRLATLLEQQVDLLDFYHEDLLVEALILNHLLENLRKSLHCQSLQNGILRSESNLLHQVPDVAVG